MVKAKLTQNHWIEAKKGNAMNKYRAYYTMVYIMDISAETELDALDMALEAPLDSYTLDTDGVDIYTELIEEIPMTLNEIANKWVKAIGIGFDPCIRSFDYSPALTKTEQRQYDKDMETLCLSEDYEGIILQEMKKEGLI
jgi:hypothetical protein